MDRIEGARTDDERFFAYPQDPAFTRGRTWTIVMDIRPKGVDKNTFRRNTEAAQDFDEMKAVRCDQCRTTQCKASQPSIYARALSIHQEIGTPRRHYIRAKPTRHCRPCVATRGMRMHNIRRITLKKAAQSSNDNRRLKATLDKRVPEPRYPYRMNDSRVVPR